MSNSEESTNKPGEESSPEAGTDLQRRKFLEKSGKLAITAPAVSLLLAASLKPEQASAAMYEYNPGPWIP